jgi:hypothetical protein
LSRLPPPPRPEPGPDAPARLSGTSSTRRPSPYLPIAAERSRKIKCILNSFVVITPQSEANPAFFGWRRGAN